MRQRHGPRAGRLVSLRVLGDVFGQELEGHEASELGILGFIHHPHATGAQLLKNAVMGNGLA